MHWHRGNTFVPSVLASALMAVEAHLYRKLDEEEDVEPEVSRYVPSPSSSHSRQTQSPSCSASALRAAGTIVTPQVGQIGGRSSAATDGR